MIAPRHQKVPRPQRPARRRLRASAVLSSGTYARGRRSARRPARRLISHSAAGIGVVTRKAVPLLFAARAAHMSSSSSSSSHAPPAPPRRRRLTLVPPSDAAAARRLGLGGNAQLVAALPDEVVIRAQGPPAFGFQKSRWMCVALEERDGDGGGGGGGGGGSGGGGDAAAWRRVPLRRHERVELKVLTSATRSRARAGSTAAAPSRARRPGATRAASSSLRSTGARRAPTVSR